MKGSSWAHWVHHEAKKLTRTGRPFKADSVSCPPSKVVAVKSGGGWPRVKLPAATAGSGSCDAGWLVALAIRIDTTATAAAAPPPIQASELHLNRVRTAHRAARRTGRSSGVEGGRSLWRQAEPCLRRRLTMLQTRGRSSHSCSRCRLRE